MKVLITGATGQLGPYVVERLLRKGAAPALWAHRRHEPLFGCAVRSVDLVNAAAAARAFDDAQPDVAIHLAAESSIAGCFNDPARARALNADAPARFAELAQRRRCHLIHCSTDLVFDGRRGGYTEADPTNPLSVYGRTKLEGEAPVLAYERGVVIRFPILFGPTLLGPPRFVDGMIAKLRRGEPVTLFNDEWRSPLAVDVAAEALVAAADAGLTGLFHVGGGDRLTRYDMGRIVADLLGLDASRLIAASRLSADAPEPRPADTSLVCDRWRAACPHSPPPPFAGSVARLWGREV